MVNMSLFIISQNYCVFSELVCLIIGVGLFIFQYKLVCAKCTDVFSEAQIYTHKYGCKNSTFDDISFLLSKENMMNVLAREIDFMIAVLDNDLAHENVKLRTDAQVYRLEKGDDTLIVTAGKSMINPLPMRSFNSY